MNGRKDTREALGLTQPDAARSAKVSLATWRRWEEDPAAVSAPTRTKCQAVLDRADQEAASNRYFAEQAEMFERTWSGSQVLTPRQAAAIVSVLNRWDDVDLDTWLNDPSEQPLHEIGPFRRFDKRVMMYINENRAFAAQARERCVAVYEEIEKGTLPFDRDGCFFDELLMAAALLEAAETLEDMPELFEDIPARERDNDWDRDENADLPMADGDWGWVSEAFEDRSRWDEWEVPIYCDHWALPAVLADSPPFTWFDLKPPTGSGYLRRLAGLAVDDEQEPTDGEVVATNGNGHHHPKSSVN